MFLRKELDNKQRITKTLLQQISKNVTPILQVENTNFNNVINKDGNIKSSKHKSSKYQSSKSPSTLINDNTMEKSALTKEKISIQLNDVRKESRKRFYQSKEKYEKRVPTETEYLTIENVAKIGSIRQWKRGTTLITGDSMLAGIEQKRKSGNRNIKVPIFTGAASHDMYDYLKTLLKKNPDNIILHIGTISSVNETSRDILNRILSLKNFIEKLRPKCEVIASNIIYWSDDGKASLTVKNVNDDLDALNIYVVDNKNIDWNCSNNSRLYLNSTGYDKLAINLIKKKKTFNKNWWPLDSFCCSPNNCDKVSYEITDFDKGKTRDKEHNSSRSANSSESNLNTLDRVRLNNANRLIICHLDINSLRNKFEMLQEIVQDKLDILLVSEIKVRPCFPSSQFGIKDFSVPCWLNRNSSVGGIMLFVREEIPSKFFSQYEPNSSAQIYL